MLTSDSKTIVFDDVSKHNKTNDCWLIIAGKVYDVTPFMEDHPGGDDVLLAAAGKDATDDFEDVGHSNGAREFMERYYIGEMASLSQIQTRAEEILRKAYAMKAYSKKQHIRMKQSPQDAALAIQMAFRAFLIRKSQVLRSLRELAVAKAKLKELRTLFNKFSYLHRVARDVEERQRFAERIIVLLLTVDAIEGVDSMTKAVRRSMMDGLEAMLDAVDPQPPRTQPRAF